MSRLITGTRILHRALPPTVDADLFTDAKSGGATDLRLACNRPEKSRHLAWLAEHPRWTFHFTPTSCSWLNAVEGFFSRLTRQSLKRGVFRSVDDLESAITRYIAATNRNPKPFVWTATAKTIQAKLTLNHPSESVH